MTASRIADLVARTFYQAGIRHAFGMPGGEVVTFIDALERAGIRFVLARNETAAAMMAAGTHAVTGAPGLLVTTLGPGLANAVNGIADASQEHAALIIVSGIVERHLRGRYTHQILDHAALLRPLVKASFEIEAEGAPAIAARALALAGARPWGPVHLDLSPSVAAEQAPQDAAPAILPRLIRPNLATDSRAIAELRQRLAEAERPLLLAGYEALRDNAADAVTKLAEHGIPVLTTYKAKGLLDEHHTKSLGAAGLSPKADAILLPLLQQADLILAAGYDPIEMRGNWLGALPHPERIVELSLAPADHGMHEAGSWLAGPVAALLTALASGLDRRNSAWPAGEIGRAKTALTQAFAAPADWGAHAVIETLEAALPPDAIVTVDSGAHRILLSQKLHIRRPGGLLQSAGFCTMGAALPLAIGAKVARPARPVVAVMGDGGLEMTLGELGTLRDQGLPIVVLVLQDESLALIELKQRQAGLEAKGVRMGATDYAAVAQAFGGVGMSVSSRAALAEALEAAFRGERFTVIAAKIDAGDYVGRI
jgi:acetolactate synthase-1/2/3 large subunit